MIGSVPFDLGGGIGLLGNPVGDKVLALLGRLLQRVGQEDPQPLLGAELVAGLLQLHAQLEMGDRIGGHEQFKTENAIQQVLCTHTRPTRPLAWRTCGESPR